MVGNRNIFTKMLNLVSLRFGYAREARRFRKLLERHNASWRTRNCREKMEYSIARQAHTIEKGMSLRFTRPGFGAAKVAHLREDTEHYRNRYGETPFLQKISTTLECYRKFLQDGDSYSSGCVITLKAESVRKAAAGNFRELLTSRHSIRCFAGAPSHDLINEALEMATLTPSACNRQAWHTRIYEGDKARELLRWQDGARGFEDEIPTAILVSADLRGFLSYETHQAWVDGGMYACNLLNSLHSLGLGTIPLSCAFDSRKLRRLADFGLPENEVPIVIIGTGELEDEFKVALSERKETSQTNEWM